MTRPTIRTLVAAHGNVNLRAVQDMLHGEDGLELAGIVANDADWATRAGFDADALLITCATAAGEILDLVSQETAARPDMPVVVLCTATHNGFVREAIQAGADDILLTEDMATSGPQVYMAFEKAMSRKSAPSHHAAQPDAGTGDLICVLGPKGGTGKTLTAANLSLALAAEGKRVALVDLDLQFGDLGLVLGLSPERSIFDLVASGGTIDAQKLDGFLAKHRSGTRVLLAPTRPDHASAVTPDFLRELYPVMRSMFDYVIVDTPPGFTPEVITTIDSASSVCLIGMLDTPSLKNAKLGAETLDLMGYPVERIRIVLNRADTSVGVTHADVVAVLGRAPDVLVPSSRDVVRAVNAGEPIVAASPRSEAAKAFRALAATYLADSARRTPVERRRRDRRRGSIAGIKG